MLNDEVLSLLRLFRRCWLRAPLLLGLLALPVSPAAGATEEAVAFGNLRVTVWSATEPANGTGRRPVLIFSHGFHGCATQSRFLMEAFAAQGFVVFAPNHRDASCGRGSAGASEEMQRAVPSFRDPGAWSDQTFRNRADDVRALVEALRTDPRFAPRVDLSRLVLAGHSLGGYTVLGLAGGWASWKIPGVIAVLALSPYSGPFILHQTLGAIDVPVMYQGGTLDFGITPDIDRANGAYDLSPPPKYMVEFARAGHLAWTNIGLAARDPIVHYCVAFLDHYALGRPLDPVLQDSEPGHASGVARFRFAVPAVPPR